MEVYECEAAPSEGNLLFAAENYDVLVPEIEYSSVVSAGTAGPTSAALSKLHARSKGPQGDLGYRLSSDSDIAQQSFDDRVKAVEEEILELEREAVLTGLAGPRASVDRLRHLMRSFEHRLQSLQTAGPQSTTQPNAEAAAPASDSIWQPVLANNALYAAERRLAALEQVVGADDVHGLGELSGPLCTVVANLSQLVRLFDRSAQNLMLAKLKEARMLQSGLGESSSGSSAGPQPLGQDLQMKLEEAYRVLVALQSVASAVPLVLRRLETLRSLHESSVLVAETVVSFRGAAEESRTLVGQAQSQLQIVEQGLQRCLERIMQEAAKVDERLSGRAKKTP